MKSLTSLKKKSNTIWRKNVEVDLNQETESMKSIRENYNGQKESVIRKMSNIPEKGIISTLEMGDESKESKSNWFNKEDWNSKEPVKSNKQDTSRFSLYIQEIQKSNRRSFRNSETSIRIKAVSIYHLRNFHYLKI